MIKFVRSIQRIFKLYNGIAEIFFPIMQYPEIIYFPAVITHFLRKQIFLPETLTGYIQHLIVPDGHSEFCVRSNILLKIPDMILFFTEQPEIKFFARSEKRQILGYDLFHLRIIGASIHVHRKIGLPVVFLPGLNQFLVDFITSLILPVGTILRTLPKQNFSRNIDITFPRHTFKKIPHKIDRLFCHCHIIYSDRGQLGKNFP